MCIKSCNGLMINGYTKFQFDKNSREDTHQTDIAYTNYKKGFKFPHGIKGNHHHNNIIIQTGSCPWNNGEEVPRWGVAEIQKMSP